MLNDPQVVHNRLIETIDQPGLGTIRQPRPAARFERTPAGIQGPAPRLGEHTEQILEELGLARSEIVEIIASGAAAARQWRP